LMGAFAGESQARNRYTFAAEKAGKENLYVIEQIFQFTAGQEQKHAQVFYDFLKECVGDTIHVDGGYPVDLQEKLVDILKAAKHNEFEEHDDVYKNFANVAKEEGFTQISSTFDKIAGIEKIHGERFGYLAELLEQGKLFISDVKTSWMCLHCGYVYEGTSAPNKCPVCDSDQGYFVRIELAPYTSKESCGI
ncbi:MAG: rubrerythrin family protein, partial [Clostridium sp.]|nr:rubrerythrin family protein [Clostridium sp.]